MHQIVLIVVAFFMFVTSSIALARNTEKDNKNLKGYYIFSLVLGIVGFGVAFLGGKKANIPRNNFANLE
jgi:hypothetical protein